MEIAGNAKTAASLSAKLVCNGIQSEVMPVVEGACRKIMADVSLKKRQPAAKMDAALKLQAAPSESR